MYELEFKKTITSRYVFFKEDVFPFHSDVVILDQHFHKSQNVSFPSYHTDFVAEGPFHLVSSPSSSSSSLPLGTSTNCQSPKRSLRYFRTPIWMQDYVCTVQSRDPLTSSFLPKTPYPLFSPYDLSLYPIDYVVSLANVLVVHEPNSYSQAKLDKGWIEAMDKELDALEKNETWDLTSLPYVQIAINSKWVYKIKYYSYGSVESLKARLVNKGYSQNEGKDYTHTFSPVAKLDTVRVFIALPIAKQWPLHQLDTNNAFLHGHITEDIYMNPPKKLFQSLTWTSMQIKEILIWFKTGF